MQFIILKIFYISLNDTKDLKQKKQILDIQYLDLHRNIDAVLIIGCVWEMLKYTVIFLGC